jgi:hypothetical protein
VTFELVIIALCVSLEPIPLTAFILTLSTSKGGKNGAGFLIGWIASLALVIVVTLALTGGKPLAPASTPSTGVLAAKIALGVGLVIFAWQYRRRPAKPHADPAWMKRMDRMSVWTAALLAFLTQPWGLVAGAALSITQANASKADDVATLVIFCVLATLSLLVMEGYVVFAPTAARARLDGLRQWIDTHRKPMIVYLSLIVGFLLISKSAYALSA